MPLNTPPDTKTINLGPKACTHCGAVNELALLDGGVDERFQVALAQVLENIADPNTGAEKARGITIKVLFVPDKERRKCDVAVDVIEKLAGLDGLYTEVYLGRHEGKLGIRKGPTQDTLFETPAPAKPIVLEGGKHS